MASQGSCMYTIEYSRFRTPGVAKTGYYVGCSLLTVPRSIPVNT